MGKKLNEKIEGVEVPDVYTFGGTSGYVSFDAITLASDGDAFEFEVLSDLAGANLGNQGFAMMSSRDSTDKRAITFARNGIIGVKTTAGSWVSAMNGALGQYNVGRNLMTKVKIKVLKDDNDLKLYIDDVLEYTATGALTSATITIDSIGGVYTSSGTDYFWKGIIYGFRYTHNNEVKELYELAGYAVHGDVTYITKRATNGLKLDVEKLQDDMENVFDTEQKTFNTDISAISGVVKLAGYSVSSDGTKATFTANSSYDSYYFYTQEAMDAWIIDNGTAYIAMCVVTNAQPFASNQIQGDSATRKRNLDSNLPTSTNPWSIPSGSAIAFTVTADKTTYFDYKKNVEVFNGDIPLADEHVEQVVNAMRNCHVDVASNLLSIFIPSASGYIKYKFIRSVNQSANLDLWKVLTTHRCDDSGLELSTITVEGEWEAAIMIAGRPDFMGGVHGDEIFTSIKCFADGALVDLATAQSGLKFKELRILETSTMYDPADNTTETATHTSEHIFTEDGLVINQSIKWLVGASLGSSYMAMFPIARAVSSKYCTDKDFTPVSIPAGGADQINIYGVKTVDVWDETSGIFCTFGVERYGDTQDSNRHFLMHGNGAGNTYNKCYFFIANSGDSVSANDIWKSTTIYKIMAGDV